MKKIAFSKMSGCGNDFIIIDNRDKLLPFTDLSRFARSICRRKLSLGADGLILIEPSQSADFKWRFYNDDGSRAEMCGNGARCVSRFAYLNNITGPELTFETDAGIIAAKVQGEHVKIRMTDPVELALDQSLISDHKTIKYSSINTGVPHVVIEVDNLDTMDVVGKGRKIRMHPEFAAAGTNVNFVSLLKDGGYAIRTYERGVEDETLACGTGCAAAALILAKKKGISSPVDLLTRSGGYLRIYFTHTQNGFDGLFLEGDARIIGSGQLWEDAWNYEAGLK
ncbi:MAG: diaminopimelate epimerase [Desulfobacteraceae bacterium]